jgi:hypothetical protein
MPAALVTPLYALCSALLLGAAFLVWLRNPGSQANRHFALASLCLLLWLGTLLAFGRADDAREALWVGRLNFAAVPPAALFGHLFVRDLANLGRARAHVALSWGTALLALLTLFTPLVDEAELVGTGPAGRHVTVFGPLFPPYLVFVAGLLATAVSLAFRCRLSAPRPQRDQLGLVGGGILATACVALVTNALLPFALGDFRYIDVGPLSTALFLLAVGYAVARHRLFDVRLFVRRTLVASLLLSFVLAAYGAVVVLATERFAGEGQGTLTRFGVLFIALSFDPLRRYLERQVDRRLFRDRDRRPGLRRAP